MPKHHRTPRPLGRGGCHIPNVCKKEMGKSFTIAPKSHNAHSVRGGYFPLPPQVVGPDTWHNLMSANYGVNPIDGTRLVKPTFDQVAELAGDALTDRYVHKEDGRFNPAFNPVIDAINGAGKVLTGNSLIVVTPTRAYFINNPNQVLRAQFGVNDQGVLEENVANFDKQLKGKKQETGIAYADNIAAVSVANVSQGTQSKDPRADTFLGNNVGLIALVRNRKVAESLAVGSKAYKSEPYFSLNAENNKIVTRVPVLIACVVDNRLFVGGVGFAVGGNRCSFGYSETGEASVQKK